MSGGCFVITASDEESHDALTGNWIGTYDLSGGRDGEIDLSLRDEGGVLTGEGMLLEDGDEYVGEIRGWRSEREIFIGLHGESPSWFDMQLHAELSLGWIEGDCEMFASSADEDERGDFLIGRERRRAP